METYPVDKAVLNSLNFFQDSGNSTFPTPKKTHFATSCDVIGHAVMMKPDILNGRA